MAAFEVAESLGAAAVHAEEVGGAGHVDVEKGAAHQEVGGLGGDVLGQFGEALRRDDAGQAAFTAAAHHVGHGGEGEAAGFFLGFAAGGGGEELRFVDDDQGGGPVGAAAVEEAGEEGGGVTELAVHFEAFEVQHDGDPVRADLFGGAGHGGFGVRRGVDDEVAVGAGQGDEVAFRVDDDLLHPGGALFEQAAQQVRFAGATVALDEQAGGEQLFEVERRRLAAAGAAHVDGDGHCDAV